MLIPNVDQPFCYCLSKEKEETMLVCQRCKKLFHLGCLQSGRPTILQGDIFFELTCAVCNDGEELLSRMKMSWMQVVILALYNLHVMGVSGKCGYYRWKDHICEFISKHWNTFFGVNKKRSGNWKGTVAGTLSAGCPVYFKSGADLLRETGWWCLSEVKPPSLDDSLPKAKSLIAGAVKKEDTKESPVKGLRERRYKHSIQAAIELKAKRDGNALTVDDHPIPDRKRTSSLSAAELPQPSTSAAKMARLGSELNRQETVHVEPQTVIIKQELGEDAESSLVDELLRSAGAGDSDDDFEVDPCALSPCPSPLMTSHTDVSQLVACISGESEYQPSSPSDLLTPSDVTSLDVSATPSSELATPLDASAPTSGVATPLLDFGAPPTGGDVTRMTSSAATSEAESEEEEEEDEESDGDHEDSIDEVKKIRYRPLSEYEERHLLRKLDTLLETKIDDLAANRLRAKLRLRQMKRERGLPVFDLDARYRQLTNQRDPAEDQSESRAGLVIENLPSRRAGDGDRVLDRFQCSSLSRRRGASEPVTFLQRLIGGADDQLSCIISPYTTRRLRPYIRRDFQSRPTKLKLLQQIIAYPHRSDPNWPPPRMSPVDYCYVRPHHIPSINNLCRQFFWPGIDLSECLEYPDFSCVVLYKKIVIAFAFLVPDVQYNQAYISFIFTHPDWRGAGIGTYMIYHLIQTCLGKDITLHVSATNPAMVLYQKLGFKPEEFVLDFYDKYYPYESKECRHAFFLRLRR